MDNLRVIEFHGDIDIVAKDWVERELGRLEVAGDEAFTIVDLTRVRYLDSTFLNALMAVRNRMAKNTPDLRISLVAPRVGNIRRLFEMAKLDAVFPLFDDVPSARRSLFAVLPFSLATPA